MTLPQPTEFSTLVRGCEGECPCCRRRLADAAEHSLEGVAARYCELALPLAVRVGVKAAKGSAIYGATVRRAIMASGLGAIGPDAAPFPLGEMRLH